MRAGRDLRGRNYKLIVNRMHRHESRLLFTRLIIVLFAGIFSLPNSSHQLSAQYKSAVLHYDENMRLVYHSDQDGNRIPDFSHAGYKGGGVALPEVEHVLEITPVSGDNTAHIQAAIDEVSGMTPDDNGIRGAVLLQPGIYPIFGTLYIEKSGVILRGSGNGEDPSGNTIIQGKGTDRRTLVIIGGNDLSKWSNAVSGSRVNITSEYLPVGNRTIEVEDASAYHVGDNIIIRHPSTQKWIDAVDGGGTGNDDPWKPGEIDMYFNSFVTHIEGNKIMLDVPLYHELDRSLSQSYAWIFTRKGLLTEMGIENLRIDIETAGPQDENHPWNGIQFKGVENCWAKDVKVLHFGKSGFVMQGTTRTTILNCQALEPHSVVEPPDRYNFHVSSACNNVLFKGCHSSESRHAFVSNGTSSVAGMVFSGCRSDQAHTASEGHRRWGSGFLWDHTSFNSTNTTRVLGLYNRGDYGTGHGWTGTNQVAWNISAPDNQIVIQKPPIGQNYAIACDATVNNKGPFSHPAGYIEGTGKTSEITSLYEAQLSERLTYGIGPDTPGKLAAPSYQYSQTSGYVDLTWLDIAMDEGGYVLERSSDGGETFQQIAQLAENSVSYRDEDPDLKPLKYLYRLKAVNDIGSSAWSNLLSVDLSLSGDLAEKTFPVSSDAYVRGGASSEINYGTDANLVIKRGSVEDFFRKTLVKIDLHGEDLSEMDIRKAYLRLYANKAAYCEIVCTAIDDNWTETGVTWKNAPAPQNEISSMEINSGNTWYEWDITDYFRAQMNEDSVVSVCLQDQAAANENIYFNSREAADHHPELVLIIADTQSSIPGYSKDFKLKIYPNPAKNMLSIETSLGRIDQLTIYSLSGQMMLSRNGAGCNVTFNIEHFTEGIYLLKAQGDFGSRVVKFVRTF